jgi:hypothetical protein
MIRPRYLHAIVTAILLAVPLISFGQGFFAPAKYSARALPKDQIYPRGRIFPFSGFSVESSGISLDQYKAAGFTMIGPQYGLHEKARADAASIQLKCIYGIGGDETGQVWFDFKSESPPAFDPKEVARRVKEQVAAVADDPAIAWWYVQSEELRYWLDNEMLYLKTVTDAIRQADPLKRPIWMYEQNHRDAKGLTHLLKYIDVAGKGAYVNYAGQDNSRVWVRWTMEQETQAVRDSHRSGELAILVPEMFEQPSAGSVSLVPAWVRHDVYLGLISGAKGIVVYSMATRNGFDAHDVYYQAYAKAAREITGPEGLGQVFLFGEPRKDMGIEVISGPKIVVQKDDFGAELGKALEYPSIAWFDAVYGEDHYLLAVNSANEPVKARISGLPPAQVEMENLFEPSDRRPMNTSGFETDFASLEVKGWRFSAAAE